MGLTFKKEDNLDDLFSKFAIEPDKLETPKQEKPKVKTDKEEEKTKK